MQYQMKNLYNFNLQIAHIQSICQSNIISAETYNCFLQKMPPQLIRRLCAELREEYEQEYQHDKDKLHAIVQVLNLLKREQVTNLDKLFMDIQEDLNTFYCGRLIKCTKNKPYRRKCTKCDQTVQSHSLKDHHAKSCAATKRSETPEGEETPAPENKQKKIKKADTKPRQTRRQEQPEQRMTKNQMRQLKREQKLEEDRLIKERRRRARVSLMCSNEYYCEQDDHQLTKKYQQQPHTQQEPQKQHSYPSFAS